MRVDRLIAEHGAEIGLPDLAVKLAGGCPKATASDLSARCFVCFPQLVAQQLSLLSDHFWERNVHG